ncbi:hypothetical protein FZC33_01760 [Labrys sp. KNU-23]|nr:hypothetical protein FZC33_01760 [Labrys sp. KNU-23]
MIRNGLQWKDAPAGIWPAQNTLQPLFRWSRRGFFRPHLRHVGQRRA